MNFSQPRVLWLGAVLLPLLALFFWATWRKRQALIKLFVQHRSLAELTLGVSTSLQKLRRVILFLAIIALLIAMAGPQWGFTWEEAAQRGRDIIVAVDTSRSMLATDVQPDRLTRAKLAALDLLKLGSFDRFGLIAFAGSAFLQCPLTFDDEAFRQSVQILEPGIIPQGGTALAQAIQTAREAYGKDTEENHKILVLFTDGEDHEAGAVEAAERAAADGVHIFTVGVGSPGGELLRVRDERGNLVYVKDDGGNVVKSRLNEQLLQQIATQAQGFYLPLQGGNAMDVLYQRGLAPLPTSERSSKLMKLLKEQYYWPLAFGILLMMIEVFVPEQKKARRKRSSETEGAPVPAQGVGTAALLFLLFLPISAQASASKAQRHYRAGEYKSSLSEYQQLIAKDPSDPRLQYNAGAAAYQAKKYDEAQKHFQAAIGSRDLDLQESSYYNLANSEFRMGEQASDPKERSAAWEQAIQHYDSALKMNAQDKDAEYNRDLVKKKLEELKKQQQQNQNQQQNKNDQDQKQDNKDQQKQDKKQESKQDNKSDQQDNKEQSKDNQQQDQQKQSEQQKQDSEEKKQQEQHQQQQAAADDKQQEKSGQARPKPGGEKESDQQEKNAEAAQAAQYAQLGKMTPQQAKQLLDAQRGEEKALMFIPQNQKSAAQNHVFKDW